MANTYTTTLRCDVTVVSNVGRVTLNQERLYLENIGGTAALRASVAVENGDAVPITWTTSNPAAATVDPFGLVTAVGDGEALITATTRTPQRLLQCLLRHAGGDPGTDRGR